jgi:hypothetical protein
MFNAINYNAPGVAEKFVLVKLEAAFPPATRKSEKAREAIVQDMIASGVDRETADKMAHSYVDLFPDGELKAIKTPFYSFNTYLDRVSIRWLGGKGAPKLVSVHMLDKIEAKFAEAQLVMLPLIEQFKADYGRTLDNLEQRTSTYFDRLDYPTVEELDRRFKFNLSFSPIGDPRQFDLGVVSESQKQRMLDAMNEAADGATKAYAKSIHQALVGDSKNPGLIKQLLGGKHGGKFVRLADNNVKNLLEMVEADLNASGSSELASALSEVKHAAELAATAAVHKSDNAIRTNAANAASRAANKLAGLF